MTSEQLDDPYTNRRDLRVHHTENDDAPMSSASQHYASFEATILHYMDECAFGLGREGSSWCVRFVNEAMRRWLGYDNVDELRAMGWSDIIAVDSPSTLPAYAANNKAMEEHESVPFFHREGHILWGRLRLYKDPSGDNPVGLIEDLSEQKDLEQKRAKLDKLDALHTLRRGLGRELNNPLSYARGNLDHGIELLEQMWSASPQDQESQLLLMQALDDARRGVERAIEMLRQTIAIEQRSPKKISQSITLRPLLDRLIEERVKTGRQRLILRIEEGLTLNGWADQLEQALVSMLDYALERCLHDNIEIMAVQTAGETHIRLIYSCDHEAKLSTQMRINLMSSRVAIEAHDGVLELQKSGAQESMGMRLPRVSIGEEISEICEDGTPKPRLMVLDDDPAILKVIRRLLQSSYHVTVVSTPKQAVSFIAQGHRIDGILCDIMLKETTGVSFFHMLQKHYPKLSQRLMFITGGNYSRRVGAAMEHLDVPLLFKPFTPEQLTASVEHLIQGTKETPPG